MPTATPTIAFSAIYDEHFAFVWAVLRRLGVDDADLDDVVQEVFIVVHRRMHAFEARASVRTWLYAIAVRVFWNHARRRRNQPAIAETSASKLAAFDGDPERFATRNEQAQLLRALLGKLDPAKRTVFVLAELEGLTAPQIAEITGANERTVYSRLRAARSSFAAGLARAQARERNDALVSAHVRELARDDRPPAGAQQRTWAALALQLAAEPAVPIAAGVGATLQAAAVSIGLGVGALGVVYAVTIPVRATEPVKATVVDGARVDDEPSRRRGEASMPAAASRSLDDAAAEDARLRESTNAVASIVAVPVDATPVSLATAATPVTAADAPRAIRERVEPPSSDAPGDAVSEELALMERARVALRDGDIDRGLRLLDEHVTRFPLGKLARERDRSRVTALCRSGRPAEADTLARTLALQTPVCPDPQ